jgi:spore coat protein JB
MRGKNTMIIDKDTLKSKIQQLEFMCVELNLYLDTHPYDMRALMEYNCYAQQIAVLKAQYEQMYGPLLGFGFGSTGSNQSWKWVKEPWPWEIGR